MNTTWNDRIGSRGRRAFCLLVTEDGAVHDFSGAPIPGVCGAHRTAFEKAGKWSNSTWTISHRPTTVVITSHEDFELGRRHPEATWDEAFMAIARIAPGVSRAGFEAYIRARCPNHAARWDEAAAAEREFTEARPLVHLDETARLVSELEERSRVARERARALEQEADRIHTARLEAERAEAEALRQQAKVKAEAEAAEAAQERARQLRPDTWAALDGLKI